MSRVATLVLTTSEVDRRFGRVIRARRQALKLTQRELGEIIDLDQATVSRIERGVQVVRFSHMLQFAMGLGVRVEGLVSEVNECRWDE